ncbi:hypothetical protein MLD38_022640 [Melastoma candidum]|uniref:Uncharacterized protein n=1 Tax=Melastoma candidum TaxID=119954 RepID=A0ACB9QMY7_9MYRT|nr:hypothetical protein MLD38_022640 [Melastoma candidum]
MWLKRLGSGSSGLRLEKEALSRKLQIWACVVTPRVRLRLRRSGASRLLGVVRSRMGKADAGEEVPETDCCCWGWRGRAAVEFEAAGDGLWPRESTGTQRRQGPSVVGSHGGAGWSARRVSTAGRCWAARCRFGPEGVESGEATLESLVAGASVAGYS